MVKNITLDAPYNEARLRSMFEIFNKFPSATPATISVRFVGQPQTIFEFDFANVDHLVAQLNKMEELTKEKW